jgi:predicted acylesterase/phospholipase RssA
MPWRPRSLAPIDYRNFPLGEAVAASSCVPGLFAPIVLPDVYPGKAVSLVDGGVHDNQGVASLLEQDCNVLIVSDASGQMEAVDAPATGRLGVVGRSFSVSMARVREAQYQELEARRQSGLLKRLVYLHLRKDLDAPPVDWRDCPDKFDPTDNDEPDGSDRSKPVPRLSARIRRLLSNLRTDLDSFTDLEAYALMTTGYRQAEQWFSEPGWPARVPRLWKFLAIEPALAEDAPASAVVERQLEVGAQTALKAWRLSPTLKVIGVVLGVAATGALGWLWWVYRDASLLSVRSLGVLVAVAVGSLVAPQLVSLARYRQRARALGLRSLLGIAGALLCKVHPLVDRIFLKRGALGRFVTLEDTSAPSPAHDR